MSASLPFTGTVAAWARRDTENSHGNWWNPPSSRTIDGTAVETIVASRATRAVDSMTAISTGPRSDRSPTSRRRTWVCPVWLTSRLSTAVAPIVPVGVSAPGSDAAWRRRWTWGSCQSDCTHDDSPADPVRHRPRLPGPAVPRVLLRAPAGVHPHPGRARARQDHAARRRSRPVLPARALPRPTGVAGRTGRPADAGPPRHRGGRPGRGRQEGRGGRGHPRGVPAPGRRTRLARPRRAPVLPVPGWLTGPTRRLGALAGGVVADPG